MRKVFANLIKLPFDIISDAVTMGGALNDEESKVSRNLKESYHHLSGDAKREKELEDKLVKENIDVLINAIVKNNKKEN